LVWKLVDELGEQPGFIHDWVNQAPTQAERRIKMPPNAGVPGK